MAAVVNRKIRIIYNKTTRSLLNAIGVNRRHGKLPYELLRRSISNSSRGTNFVPFDLLVDQRRTEAQRSMLVEVSGKSTADDLYNLCSQYGQVNSMLHYVLKNKKNNSKDLILVEFNDISSLKTALENSHSLHNVDYIPIHSPLLSLATQNTKSKKYKMENLDNLPISSSSIENICDEDLMLQLSQCQSFSEQMLKLYEEQKMADLGWRLRFFACRQVESTLSGLFPKATVLPFGSSVNTFGRANSDLDMILDINNFPTINQEKDYLVFQAKKCRSAANPRITMQRHMEVIADILNNFVPGCLQVRKILHARVPIIKYHQSLMNLECDLSMGSRSGYYMSELLYLYGCMDDRVRPLVFAIRRWAQEKNITSPQAGRWLTNFSLTLLILFYLMNTSPAIITPLQNLIKLAGPKDYRTAENINCTFLRDLNRLARSGNCESLDSLLVGFFVFYDNFNFKQRGVSIVTGDNFFKPEHSALYIQNPLERELNVSRNVTVEEIDRIQREIRHARYRLEGSGDSLDNESLMILWDGQMSHSNGGMFSLKRPNAVDWSEVFHVEEEDVPQIKINTEQTRQQKLNLEEVQKNNANTQPERKMSNENEKVKERENVKEPLNASDLESVVSKLKETINRKKGTPVKKSKMKMRKKLTFKF